MHRYTLHYRFNNEPRTHQFELKQSELSAHEAAMHLLQLHVGDVCIPLMLTPSSGDCDPSALEVLTHPFQWL